MYVCLSAPALCSSNSLPKVGSRAVPVQPAIIHMVACIPQAGQVAAAKPAWDEKGYIMFALTHGRFGNQADAVLGGLRVAKEMVGSSAQIARFGVYPEGHQLRLFAVFSKRRCPAAKDRTLILPHWVEYHGRDRNYPAMSDFFDVDELAKFHRVIGSKVCSLDVQQATGAKYHKDPGVVVYAACRNSLKILATSGPSAPRTATRATLLGGRSAKCAGGSPRRDTGSVAAWRVHQVDYVTSHFRPA